MRIHHLNCMPAHPRGGRWIDGGDGSVFGRGELACHCLLVEAGHRLVLVDTGLGLRDVAHPRARLSRLFRLLLHHRLCEEMTAVRQIQRLGLDPRDVRDIVLTHLGFDHAGGLDDFPHARVHLLARERVHAEMQRSWLDRQRYRPQQWASRSRWRTYSSSTGQQWMGFDAVLGLDGVPYDILLVPMAGHTCGHAAVAVKGPDRWHLHAGDAYFHHRELDEEPYCTPGLRLYQRLMELDREARLENQARLRRLRREHPQDVEVFCSHDASEFARLAGTASPAPAEAASA